MAEIDFNESPSVVRSSFESAVWQNGVPNQITQATNYPVTNIGIFKNGTSENSITDVCNGSFTESSMDSINMSQVRILQISSIQMAPTQIGSVQTGICENGISHSTIGQTSSEQISSGQISFIQIGSGQIGSPQVDITQNSSFKINGELSRYSSIMNQIDSSKVTLPTSISSQKLSSGDFPDHDNFSKINNIESTAISFWNTSLKTFIPLNVKISVSDLPIGQLAEGTITGYQQF
jgi:hypothetical protein